jgi:hypothetical protein
MNDFMFLQPLFLQPIFFQLVFFSWSRLLISASSTQAGNLL